MYLYSLARVCVEDPEPPRYSSFNILCYFCCRLLRFRVLFCLFILVLELLEKEEMKVVAAYLLAVLGGNASPSADDIKGILGSGIYLIFYFNHVVVFFKKNRVCFLISSCPFNHVSLEEKHLMSTFIMELWCY